jgi:DNA-binding SARP family transcriptional activator
MEGTRAREDRANRANRANRIQFNLLGAAEAFLNGRAIAFRTRKSLALLAYLALDPGPHPRERLADLLWPEADVVDARTSLRTALIYVRQALGPSGDSVIMATRESLGVRPGAPLDLDVQALADALQLARGSQGKMLRGQIEAAVDQYRGPFLAGLLLPDAPDFEAWIETQRTYWSRVESELLDRLASRQMGDSDPAAAISTLERWTSLNPEEDTAWQRLIDAQLRSEDPAGARRAWSAYRQAMAELDTEPSQQMAELGNQIFGFQGAKHRDGPAAIVTLGGRAGVWKARLVSDFLKSMGSGEADVAELERWLKALKRDTATLRLELKATVDAGQPTVSPVLAMAL